MTQIATEVQNSTRADPMNPVVPSSYNEALDSVRNIVTHRGIVLNRLQIRLADTFLGIANSLTKPRGALMKTST